MEGLEEPLSVALMGVWSEWLQTLEMLKKMAANAGNAKKNGCKRLGKDELWKTLLTLIFEQAHSFA